MQHLKKGHVSQPRQLNAKGASMSGLSRSSNRSREGFGEQIKPHYNCGCDASRSPSPSPKYRDTGTMSENRMRHNGNKENESGRRTLLAITVEIEDGCIEHIQMKEGDSAEAVATKFCRDHSLPDQFVAPLTEHIVSNIISISKEDKDIVFCSKEECSTYEENWPQQSSTGGCHMEPENDPDYECKSGRDNFRNADFAPLSQSQKVNKSSCGRLPSSPKKAKLKTRRMLSERLLAPTHTSRAKMSALDKKEQKHKCKSGPISERAKAVYMRLYAEFLRHKEKLEEDRKRSLDLYQEKIERDKTCISKKSWRIMRMRGRTAKQYRNYGELLYTEGLAKRENQMKLIAKKQKDDEARELAELTGKPEISKRAKQLRREQGQVWNRLGVNDKPREEQLQDLRNEIWEAKLMECTFKPQINHRRGRFDDASDGSPSRFEQLFLDAESRLRRQAEYLQWYPEGVTFRPAINRRLNNEMEGDFEGSVFDRLLNYANKLNEKKQMQEQLCHRPIDQNTGRELFTPLTGRKPQIDRNPSTLPIGEFLYKMRSTLDSKKESLAERDRKLQKEQANCHYVGPTSQKLLGRIRERGFKDIFDALDEDKDGYVHLCTADLQRVSQDVVQDVKEIIKQGNGEQQLSLSQFCRYMDEVQEKKHKGTQVHLIVKHKRHSDDSNLTFQCTMDRVSRGLASRRRRFSSSRQWYKIIIMDREKRQQRIEALRQERQNMEMAECTFRPELYGKGHKSKSRLGKGLRSFESSSSKAIVEKESKEVHGFYFQDERGSEWLGLPASEAANAVLLPSGSHAVLLDSDSQADASPLGLLESLKLMVAQSLETVPAGGGRPYQAGTQGQEVNQQEFQASFPPEEFDLPDPDGDKSGMFFGVMGV